MVSIKERRDFFKLELRVETPSVILDNIKVDFKGIELYSEDEENTIEIKNRRFVVEKSKTLEGFRILLFILNEGEELEERIDYLFDEEYKINKLDLTIKDKNKEYSSYKINEDSFEQVKGKQVDVEISEEVTKALDVLSRYALEYFGMSAESAADMFYDNIKKDEQLINTLNNVSNIAID